MDRHRTVNTSKEDIRARATIKNKENPLSDTVYLIQNENEVLRMKYFMVYSEIAKSI